MKTPFALAAAALLAASPLAWAAFQFVVTGTVVAVNPAASAVVVEDANGRRETVFVDPRVAKKLEGGEEITAVLEPGSAVAQAVDLED